MLIAVTGNVGSGKTLTLAYLALQDYLKGNTIYANFALYNMDYYFMNNPDDFNEMKDGLFVADELWLWADSRLSMSKKNKFISKVLARSRHKKVDICYTVQDIRQIDARIRRITDLIILPRLVSNEKFCIAEWHNMRTHDTGTIRYRTRPIFSMYDTYEDLSYLEGEEDVR